MAPWWQSAARTQSGASSASVRTSPFRPRMLAKRPETLPGHAAVGAARQRPGAAAEQQVRSVPAEHGRGVNGQDLLPLHADPPVAQDLAVRVVTLHRHGITSMRTIGASAPVCHGVQRNAMTVNVERISRIGSERAIGGNNIVTRDGVCHVVWQDVSREGYLNRVRSYRYDTGRWTEPLTLNVGVDNHARPVITVDHEGRLHVVLSGHGTPVTYRCSAGVNDSSEWTPEQPAGSGTYPILVCAPDNTLFLTMRPDRPFGADLFIKEPGEPWRRQARLIPRTEQIPGRVCRLPQPPGNRPRRRPALRLLLLRGAGHNRAARAPPGAVLHAEPRPRPDLAEGGRHAGGHSRATRGHGRAVSDQRPAPRADASSGSETAWG